MCSSRLEQTAVALTWAIGQLQRLVPLERCGRPDKPIICV
jgi:hypothetical protein